MIDKYRTLEKLIGNILDAPGKGGNVSVKSDTFMLIKSSGEDLKTHKSIVSYMRMSDDALIIGGKPSMEYSFHKIIPSKYIIHYHPVYILPYLCGPFEFNRLTIPYKNPGKELCDELSKHDLENHGIIYLQNHGVIIHANEIGTIKYLHKHLKDKFFKKNNMSYTPDDHVDVDNDELWLFRHAMENIARLNDVFLKEISIEDQNHLDFDKDEKYRMGEK